MHVWPLHRLDDMVRQRARNDPAALADPVDTATLRRAAYDGTPGHPVLIGRDHWAAVATAARGDRGARDYLAAHATALVECGDLATGVDVDSPTFGQPRRQ